MVDMNKSLGFGAGKGHENEWAALGGIPVDQIVGEVDGQGKMIMENKLYNEKKYAGLRAGGAHEELAGFPKTGFTGKGSERWNEPQYSGFRDTPMLKSVETIPTNTGELWGRIYKRSGGSTSCVMQLEMDENQSAKEANKNQGDNKNQEANKNQQANKNQEAPEEKPAKPAAKQPKRSGATILGGSALAIGGAIPECLENLGLKRGAARHLFPESWRKWLIEHGTRARPHFKGIRFGSPTKVGAFPREWEDARNASTPCWQTTQSWQSVAQFS
ncbi:heat-labile enterotoxin alpha chain domain-containing protein [Hirsutella rhossiliensis]|uniref:Heat-labile enterotoxin alpha chain domain-containing protein n=1 Tax=Hirsutella rhossiliensis TaxID=111463 RepID=A0A9P8SGH1_9HYPO|nr:heat-labile enterotoxin alpha chain domain-containing protein [Hirsutella rhossiliensis]KAH0962043.1 heat-labile enterotoxin alpha chain domain-containing protein [Hirsutella rhossiliensis]